VCVYYLRGLPEKKQHSVPARVGLAQRVMGDQAVGQQKYDDENSETVTAEEAVMAIETLEPREKLVVCLRAEVAALHEALHAAYVAEADAVVQARAADLACAEAQAAQVESDYG
jgi:hypothetical protein